MIVHFLGMERSSLSQGCSQFILSSGHYKLSLECSINKCQQFVVVDESHGKQDSKNCPEEAAHA